MFAVEPLSQVARRRTYERLGSPAEKCQAVDGKSLGRGPATNELLLLVSALHGR